MTRSFKIAGLAATAALLAASGAQAHAHLVRATPVANATVSKRAVLHLEFSETLEPKFSAVELMKADGAAVAVSSKAGGKSIDGVPTAPLAPGGYRVMWHALSADGHKSNGQYNFTVK